MRSKCASSHNPPRIPQLRFFPRNSARPAIEFPNACFSPLSCPPFHCSHQTVRAAHHINSLESRLRCDQSLNPLNRRVRPAKRAHPLACVLRSLQLSLRALSVPHRHHPCAILRIGPPPAHVLALVTPERLSLPLSLQGNFTRLPHWPSSGGCSSGPRKTGWPAPPVTVLASYLYNLY